MKTVTGKIVITRHREKDDLYFILPPGRSGIGSLYHYNFMASYAIKKRNGDVGRKLYGFATVEL